jgi:putative restriction endonuclease
MVHDATMRAYVGVTDGDWWRSLAARQATEVNFWQPGGGRRFGAIGQGAPFLFKSHYQDPIGNRIVGVGFLSGWASLRVSQAWEIFGPDNGCDSMAEMQARIAKYRRAAVIEPDPEIGCIMLRDVTFSDPQTAPPAPPDWSANIVQGKTYDLAQQSGSYVEDLLLQLLATSAAPQHPDAQAPALVPGPIYGDPRLTSVRVGQRAFKALVQEAYGRRCAITGDKIVPVLQAAHIRPITNDGDNRVDNGLLLRSDVHTLFDRGYLGVHPDAKTLLVSPRLRRDWGNGEEFYARAASGQAITTPARAVDRPHRDFLEWHTDTVYLSA